MTGADRLVVFIVLFTDANGVVQSTTAFTGLSLAETADRARESCRDGHCGFEIWEDGKRRHKEGEQKPARLR